MFPKALFVVISSASTIPRNGGTATSIRGENHGRPVPDEDIDFCIHLCFTRISCAPMLLLHDNAHRNIRLSPGSVTLHRQTCVSLFTRQGTHDGCAVSLVGWRRHAPCLLAVCAVTSSPDRVMARLMSPVDGVVDVQALGHVPHRLDFCRR